MKSYKIIIFLLIINLIIGCTGKQKISIEEPQSKMAVLEEDAETVTFREAGGKVVKLKKNPKKTIVTLNSILDVWYMAGGTSLARIKGSVNVPEEAKDLPQLGSISSLNTELMMELDPDFLIISYSETQNKIRDFFAAEGVPGVAIKYNTYEDFLVILDLFTRLNSTKEIYQKTLVSIQYQVQSVIDQAPSYQRPSVCILFATTRYVKVETQNTITGYYCEKLGADNIYKETKLEVATRVNLSLEYILEKDPDVIFVTTMGNVEKCRARMDKDITASDIWRDLKAVKNKRFHYLDKSFSIYKPNRSYPEAFKTMAEHLYPQKKFKFKEQKG